MSTVVQPAARRSTPAPTFEARTARHSSMSPENLPDGLRIVWLAEKGNLVAGFDICYVSEFSDTDRGNESAALIADAVTDFIARNPDRLPKHWVAMLGF